MDKQARFYATISDIKIHYLEFPGSGPDVIILPGIMSPAMTWAWIGERLSKHAHVYIMDARGRGLSDQRAGLGHSLADYARDAAGLIQELAIKPAIVLGHSMGARIGLRVAADFPETVKKLIIADPPVSGPGRRPYPVTLENYFIIMGKAQRGEALQKAANFTDEQHRTRCEWAPTCTREAISESYRSFHEEDIFELMPSVRCPTLLMYAEHGGTVLDEDACEIIATIPDSRAIKIRGVSHMMPWDNLDRFFEPIIPYIKIGTGS